MKALRYCGRIINDLLKQYVVIVCLEYYIGFKEKSEYMKASCYDGTRLVMDNDHILMAAFMVKALNV